MQYNSDRPPVTTASVWWSPHLGHSGVGGLGGFIHTFCVRVTQFLYRKAECIRESAERDRRSQWHHAVAEESEPLRAVLQCSGYRLFHARLFPHDRLHVVCLERVGMYVAWHHRHSLVLL